MSKKHFERLSESVIEAGKIMRGEMKPSREFTLEVEASEITPPVETRAICVETDDEELLIPGKLYLVKISGDAVVVRDEEDEVALYSSDFFIPVALPLEITQKLSNLAHTA